MPSEKKSSALKGKLRGVSKWQGVFVSLAAALLVSGCAQNGVQLQPEGLGAPKKAAGPRRAPKQRRPGNAYYSDASSGRLTERHCLERAMFFESNRSSRDGLVAVGTVVMNRVHSSQYPSTICGVVGQKSQFAPGVLTRPINMALIPDVAAAADAVLRGERSPKLKSAMYFHTAGMRFPYNNMHYVLVAGGNSFYEKRRRDGSLSNPVNDATYNVAYAYAQERGELPPASAALDGAVRGAEGAMQLASARLDPRAELLQTAYRSEPAGMSAADAANASVAEAANASLRSAYDSRSPAEQSRANEAAAGLAAESVPVPILKASFSDDVAVPPVLSAPAPAARHKSAAKPAEARQTAMNTQTPHFMPISPPEFGGEGGAIRETSGFVQPFKAPAR